MDEIKAARDAYIRGFGADRVADWPSWCRGVGCGWDDASNPQLVVNVATEADRAAATEHATRCGIVVPMRVCVVGGADRA